MAQRKKILIFTCTGGGGHIAATNALMEHLGSHYLMQPIFPLKTFLSPIRLFSRFTFGHLDGENTYNYCVRKGYSNLLNTIARFGCWYFSWTHTKATKRIYTFLQETKPDLVISVMPLINGSTLEACKQLGTPFLVIATDLNTVFYLCNIKKPTYEKFIFTIPLEERKIREIVQTTCIPENQTIVTGFLIRPAFFKLKTQEQKQNIKDAFGIPASKPVLMLLMGAQGSVSILEYVKKLAGLKTSVHLIIAIGKSGELKEQIEKISLPPHLSCTIIGYTDRMPDLMAITDLLITKAGPNSIAEALYSGIPMLIDTTNSVLSWEQFNVDFALEHGLGKCVTKLDDVAPLVDELLGNKDEYEAIKKRIVDLPKKNGLEEIMKLIEKLLR